MRKINISNESRRDAEVAFGNISKRTKTVYKTLSGSIGHSERRLKSTIETEPDALLQNYADSLPEALMAEDPEIDMEKAGLKLVRFISHQRRRWPMVSPLQNTSIILMVLRRALSLILLFLATLPSMVCPSAGQVK